MKKIEMVFILFTMICVVGPFLCAQGNEPSGKVVISFTVERMFKIASDQIAVWIEDEKGGFVRTIFVSNFLGMREGWKLRPQTTPMWQEHSNAKSVPQSEIDAVSGATPFRGPVTFEWDLTDRQGNIVPKGIYRYLIEGNISWEKTVLWTGTISIGGSQQTSRASPIYMPTDAEKLGQLILDVSALYDPDMP